MNSQPPPIIRPPVLTTPTSLAECSMVCEHHSDRSEKAVGSRLASFTRLLLDKKRGGGCIQNLRILGAACPNITLVAKDVAEFFWDIGPHAWGFAAAVIILTESGGAVFACAGWWGSSIPESERTLKPHNIWNRRLIAVRFTPNLPRNPGSGRELQKQLAEDVLEIVEDIPYPLDGIH